ncbi:MAG: PspC domain-containing protein [Candidatus Omnitrophica bacterium]|nr:PspC domain-containing protein [Candidatus Omnitrophota bacterium]
MKKLCRIYNERKIAGVCSGLGEYYGMDPVIFRMVFILMFFFTVGMLLYLVMWIILPLSRDKELSPEIKRLYAVEQDKKVAGICSGLGEFFAVDPNIFRIIFVVSALAGGLGVFAYLVMCFVVPRNNTPRPRISHD